MSGDVFRNDTTSPEAIESLAAKIRSLNRCTSLCQNVETLLVLSSALVAAFLVTRFFYYGECIDLANLRFGKEWHEYGSNLFMFAGVYAVVYYLAQKTGYYREENTNSL